MSHSHVRAFFEKLGEASFRAEFLPLLEAKRFAEIVAKAERAGLRFTVSELQAGTPADFFKGIANAANTVGNEVVKAADTVGEEVVHAADTAGDWVVGAANTVGHEVVNAADTVGHWVVGAANTVGEEVVDVAKKAGEALNPTHW